MAWKLAPSLTVLFKEVDLRWPGRDRTSDGSIGDAAHSARKSEHNPNREPDDDVPDGYVTAIDIDSSGIDADKVIDALVHDPRTWYVIHKGRIRSRTYGFANRAYTGSNPHTGHIHISLNQNKASCDSVKPWGIALGKPTVTETPYQRVARIAAQRYRKIKNLQKKLRRK